MIEKYIELSLKKKAIEDEMEAMKEAVMEEVGDNKVIIGDAYIQKIVRRTAKLRPEFTVLDVMNECPDGVKHSIDSSWLQKNEEGHKFIEFERSEALTVKRVGSQSA